MFRTSLLLAIHSKTDCNSLLRVSLTSLAVVADAYKMKDIELITGIPVNLNIGIGVFFVVVCESDVVYENHHVF